MINEKILRFHIDYHNDNNLFVIPKMTTYKEEYYKTTIFDIPFSFILKIENGFVVEEDGIEFVGKEIDRKIKKLGREIDKRYSNKKGFSSFFKKEENPCEVNASILGNILLVVISNRKMDNLLCKIKEKNDIMKFYNNSFIDMLMLARASQSVSTSPREEYKVLKDLLNNEESIEVFGLKKEPANLHFMNDDQALEVLENESFFISSEKGAVIFSVKGMVFIESSAVLMGLKGQEINFLTKNGIEDKAHKKKFSTILKKNSV